ncbi:MAG: hypothetical protein M1309_00465, partial [Actinobacteria bacterium]|nr:hypothetical protein [Actinomycetota bacterium]
PAALLASFLFLGAGSSALLATPTPATGIRVSVEVSGFLAVSVDGKAYGSNHVLKLVDQKDGLITYIVS